MGNSIRNCSRLRTGKAQPRYVQAKRNDAKLCTGMTALTTAQASQDTTKRGVARAERGLAEFRKVCIGGAYQGTGIA